MKYFILNNLAFVIYHIIIKYAQKKKRRVFPPFLSPLGSAAAAAAVVAAVAAAVIGCCYVVAAVVTAEEEKDKDNENPAAVVTIHRYVPPCLIFNETFHNIIYVIWKNVLHFSEKTERKKYGRIQRLYSKSKQRP